MVWERSEHAITAMNESVLHFPLLTLVGNREHLMITNGLHDLKDIITALELTMPTGILMFPVILHGIMSIR
jgi:hypothetical protein